MYNLIKKKNWFFFISLLIIIPGLISLMLWKLDVGIDFIGGSQVTYALNHSITPKTVDDILSAYAKYHVRVLTTQTSGQTIIVKTQTITNVQNSDVIRNLHLSFGPYITQEEFETVGPVIGSETTRNALYAIIFASLLIVLYIAWSFRKVPKPASSWRFGVCAIIALIHDVLVLLGLFSLFGHFFNVEVDSLFVTAILTVIGFSVHDTIVVFDRVRENLVRHGSASFTQTVNDSIIQTLSRSLNTSLTAVLVLFSLLLFGGESIRWFIVALLIGIISGTYSSIFNAAPLLVVWHEWDQKRRLRKSNKLL